ncbi:MAG: cytochrome c553 [Psychromonas sp.]|jgi:cytochrome c553
MKKLLLASLFLIAPTLVSAADIEAGKAKSVVCAACHGANGISVAPIYPNLKGQKEAYLLSSLKAYKAGERKGGMSMLMTPQAMALSDADIVNLSAYFSSL